MSTEIEWSKWINFILVLTVAILLFAKCDAQVGVQSKMMLKYKQELVEKRR
jgi:hypothetical protein